MGEPKLCRFLEIVEPCWISNLQCYLCKKWLSVAPILLDANGQNVCGRCRNDSNLFMRNIPYEILARQFLFPCQFSENGCIIKKSFDEIKDHQATCPYRIIKCKFVQCDWSGIPTELIMHFTKFHPDKIISYQRYKKLKGNLTFFLLHHENGNFLIDWNYCLSSFTIKIDSLDLSCVIHNDFTFKLFLYIKDGETNPTVVNSVQVNTRKEITLPTLTKSLSLKVSLSGATKKKDILKDIRCPNCSHQMVPPIVQCSVGHLTCVDCTNKNFNFCRACNTTEIFLRRVPRLELLAASTLYKCRWEDCNNYASVREIRIHEQACNKRIFICLHCPLWEGTLNWLRHHDDFCEFKPDICPMSFTTKVTVRGDSIRNQEYESILYSLIAYKELFRVCFDKDDFGIQVNICNYGVPSTYGWYEYEVFLEHVTNIRFLDNKTYKCPSKTFDMCTIIIPNSDTLRFSASENFKVTVKINMLEGDERNKKVEEYFKIFK